MELRVGQRIVLTPNDPCIASALPRTAPAALQDSLTYVVAIWGVFRDKVTKINKLLLLEPLKDGLWAIRTFRWRAAVMGIVSAWTSKPTNRDFSLMTG
jgi:hypothetical protein